MTGVGQFPCADTPSPIPRLTSPDAHMSHSLSLSLWEQQRGCLRGPGPEDAGGREVSFPGPLPRSTECTFRSQDIHPGTLPGTSPFPRTPPPAPRTQLPPGDCLLSGSRTGKPSLALRGNGRGPHSSSTAHPSRILAPARGSSSRQQEGPDWHKFPLSSACGAPGLPSKSQTGTSMPGAKASKLPRGAQHASCSSVPACPLGLGHRVPALI